MTTPARAVSDSSVMRESSWRYAPTRAASAATFSTAYHTGSSAWEWLTSALPFGLPSDTTAVELRLVIVAAAAAGYFGAALLCTGATAAQLPHAHHSQVACVHGHNLGTGATTVKVETSTDNFATAAVQAAAAAPTTDSTYWVSWTEDTTATGFRVTITPAAGSPAPEIGELFVGDCYTSSGWPAPGIDPFHRQAHDELPVSETGAPLGRSVPFETKTVRLIVPWAEASEVVGGLTTWWAHAGTTGKPFFFCFNDGEYARSAMFAWLPVKPTFSAPLEAGLLTPGFAIDMRGMSS